MSSPDEELDAALAAAAEALPSHFASSEGLTLEPLSAIQATTLSLPGGAYAIESVVKGAGNVGSVILIVTGLIDHVTGEILDRSEAREKWSAALTEVLEALKAPWGDLTPGQVHMTDAFDVLEKADESHVVGLFSGQTLAALLLTLPAEATGQGAAAELAAAIEAAEAQAEAARGADADGEVDVDPEADTDADAEDSSEQAGSDTSRPDGEDGNAAEAQEAPATQQPEPAQAGAAADAVAAEAVAPAHLPAFDAPEGTHGLYVPPPPRDPRGPMEGAVMTLAPLTGAYTYSVDPRRIDLLRDVMMGVSVELGRTRMPVQQILGLIPGSIIELDRAAGAPVDVLVNGKLIAHGEVVVVDEEFAVRISEICSADRDRRASA